MKIMLLNGSPHEFGCSAEALKMMENQFHQENVETERFWVGDDPLNGCIACKKCVASGRCAIDDGVNEFLDRTALCDGIVMGAPVHYSGVPGALVSFLNRAFYTARAKREVLAYKPAAAVVSARRAGTTSAMDVLNKYFLCMEMVLVSGRYWPAVHGQKPEDIKHDEEGVQILTDIASNMVWFLRCKEAANVAGISLPQKEPLKKTNFITE